MGRNAGKGGRVKIVYFSQESWSAEEKQRPLLRYQEKELSHRMLNSVKIKGRQVREQLGRPPLFMEVCGTHTMAFSRTGLRKNMEGIVELHSGPGCPVCVTGQLDIDKMIALAREKEVLLGTFGDMLRVPGTYSSLEREKAAGSNVEIFYSPSDAVEQARKYPSKEVVFIGIGFETTAPAVALAIAEAKEKGVENFSLFSLHKLVPPALQALLNSEEIRIDGFILPGHVCAVIGRKGFDFLSRDHFIPAVVTGFEPLDLVGSIDNLLDQLQEGTCRVNNNYTRVVREEGNPVAQQVIKDYYKVEDASWRGLGNIPSSGLVLKEEFKSFDAAQEFNIEVSSSSFSSTGCSCGRVLAGRINPPECALFSEECTPAAPQGPCMVSSEGACAAYYYYEA